jgi:hypothetical protein
VRALLEDLGLSDRKPALERRVQSSHAAAIGSDELIIHPSHELSDHRKCAFARASGLARYRNVTDPITQEREGVVGERRTDELALFTRSRWLPVGIENFHDPVFGMNVVRAGLALRDVDGLLGASILIEAGCAKDFQNELPLLIEQRLGSGDHRARPRGREPEIAK